MNWLYSRLRDFTPEEYQMAEQTLSPTRRQRFSQLRQPEDRLRTLAGQLLAKQLLDRFYGIPVSELLSDHGRPVAPQGRPHISIAHSGEGVVCAVSDGPVGIDIEQIRPMDLAITRHICTPEETLYLFGHSPRPEELCLCTREEILLRFFEIWTGKEAYFKKCGTGITSLRSINILPLPRKIILRDGFVIQIME